MNVLVTGGTGFIGHNVVLDLLEDTDWEFTIVDAHTYAGAPEKLTNDPRFDPKRVRVITHDLAQSPLQDRPLIRGLEVDAIYNIASNSHVDNSIADPVPFIRDNVALVTNMLEYARVVKPKLFVQFSTDEVYGAAPTGTDFPEWAPILPSNPYSASKAAQEAVAISYWRTYGVPLVITNTMNVLGKGQHPEKFVPKTVEHLLGGVPMTVHAQFVKGKQYDNFAEADKWVAGSRFYTYVSNISSALKFLTKVTPALYGTHEVDRPDRYNVVGDREVFNDEMVDMIAMMLGVPSLKEYVDFHGERPGHDRRYALDGGKLAALGWVAPVRFSDGLKLTVEDAMNRKVRT